MALVSDGVFLNDPQIAAVCELWQNYLGSRPDSLYDNPYWNAAEKLQFNNFDLLTRSEIGNVYRYAGSYKPTILSVKQEGKYYRIRTMFAMQADSGYCDPIAITNVYARRERSGYRLYNSLPVATASWQRHTLGSVTFISPAYHRFNRTLATRLVRFVDSVAARLGVPKKHCQYYYADTFDELMHAQGFDYYIGEGNKRSQSGYTDPANSILYGGGANEWYPHEFVHVYANAIFTAADEYFLEGLAVFLGGSRGRSCDELIAHADSLIQRDRRIDLDSAFAGSYRSASLDYTTSAASLLGGVVCKMAYEQGGWPLVLEMMRYGPTPTVGRYRFMKEHFGVDATEVGTFLRRKIAEYAAHTAK